MGQGDLMNSAIYDLKKGMSRGDVFLTYTLLIK